MQLSSSITPVPLSRQFLLVSCAVFLVLVQRLSGVEVASSALGAGDCGRVAHTVLGRDVEHEVLLLSALLEAELACEDLQQGKANLLFV